MSDAVSALSLPFPAVQTATLRIGFVPLTDALPLLVAHERGLFARHGAAVELQPSASWASLRDRLAFDACDAAHLLSPLPIALALGLGEVQREVVIGSTLGVNGNLVVLGTELAGWLQTDTFWPLPAATFARALAERRSRTGARPPVIAVVYPFSPHNYLLRRWLREAAIDPDRDLHFVAVPPSVMPQMLADGDIDGFCAGEPWGSLAVSLGAGRAVLATGHVWANHPEKILAFPASLVAADRPRVVAVVAAVLEAARWLDDPANGDEVVGILGRILPAVPTATLALALRGRAVLTQGGEAVASPALRFAGEAIAPAPEHGDRWVAEMRACGHLPGSVDPFLTKRLWSPDLWHDARRLLDDAPP